ncbi:hypothetical protein evm_004090 [Chilo suppressalis]|nr:hypothetical protein evm_004090 [Chilo suppressalis]
MAYIFSLICLSIYLINDVESLQMYVTNNGPSVIGSKITFTAVVTDYSNEFLKYSFYDNAQPQHDQSFINSTGIMNWTVEYPKRFYEAGEYTTTVFLMKNFIGIWINVATSSTTFNLTESLNGNLRMSQSNKLRPNRYVSVNQPVIHYVQLPDNEMEFLKRNASKVVTYWFKDCTLIDQTTDLSLNYTYTDLMGDHYIEALVVADNLPLPPLTTTTTSTRTTTRTTTTTTTTTPKPHTSSLPPANVTVLSNNTHKLVRRSVSSKSKKVGSPLNFVCYNTSIVPIGDTYTYGHYQETISVADPVATINITGLNWLQHGDLLRLNVKYSGTPPFQYCVQYKVGQYNVTGNETCNTMSTTNSTEFPLIHYFSGSDQHTVVVIVENLLTKNVSRATINIYKVTVHAQLSVIVVPVVFCLLAVILVVFGIAFYQHRSRIPYDMELRLTSRICALLKAIDF